MCLILGDFMECARGSSVLRRLSLYDNIGLSRWCSGKEPPCQCRRCKRRGFHPWVGTIPWRRLWQASPVFLPGKSQDRGAWRVTFHGVAKTQTQLSSHPTQPPSVSPAFSCQEQSVAARISGRPLPAPENQPDHFLCKSPKSFLRPLLHLLHIRFSASLDSTLPPCPLLS